jgi:membrane protein DedA with SNARE-associated domain
VCAVSVSTMADFITRTLESLDYAGVALLMVLENLFPPIPSEVVMPSAGAAARAGEASLTGMILAGTLGSVLGTLPWYGAGRWIGTERLQSWVERHGHWLGTDADEIARMDAWFDRYGYWAVFLGRLVPGVRTLISVPAGISEMPMGRYLLATTIGTAAWTALLAGVGYWVEGESDTLARILKLIGMGVIGLLAVLYIIRVVRRRREKSAAHHQQGGAAAGNSSENE